MVRESDDCRLAVEWAMQAAERLGEDMAVMHDLGVQELTKAEEPVLEIIRCPSVLKRVN